VKLKNGTSVYAFPGTYIETVDGKEVEVVVPRCESRKREGKRSWRCILAAGHVRSHLSIGGGRRW
jgi:hypothetical protein